MNIGQRIKLRRTELNLSVDDIADALRKDRSTVYRYESNEIEKLPTTILEPLAKVLRTTPAHLMGWEEYSSNIANTSENCNESLLTDTEKHVLSSFRKLNSDDQKYVVKTIDMVADRYKDTDYDIAAFQKHKHINIEDNE